MFRRVNLVYLVTCSRRVRLTSFRLTKNDIGWIDSFFEQLLMVSQLESIDLIHHDVFKTLH